MINYIRLMIEFHSKGEEKKKDLYAIYIYLYVSIFIGGSISIFKKSNIFENIKICVESLIFNIKALFDYSPGESIIYRFPAFYLDFSLEILLIKYIVLTFIIYFFIFLIFKKVKIKRSYLFFIITVIQIAIYFTFFEEAILLLILIVIILILLFYFIPIGSGAYFSIIEYSSFLLNMYQFKLNKLSFKSIFKFIGLIIFTLYLFYIFLKTLIPMFTFYLTCLIYMALVVLLIINTSKNKVESNLKKILAYSIIIIFVIFNQNAPKENLIEFVFSIITVFLSLERVISSFKDLKKEIEENSHLYILEKKADDIDWLIKNTHSHLLNEHNVPSESLLLKEIIITYHLNRREDLIKLISLYEQNYELNNKFVQQLKYLILYSDGGKTLDFKIDFLREIIRKEPAQLNVFSIIIEYAWLLFKKNTDHEEIVELLSSHVNILDDETKFILYLSYLTINRIDDAEYLKREINDFAVIQENMKDFIIEEG